MLFISTVGRYLPVSMDTTVSMISSARALSWPLLRGAMGWGVKIVGYSGVPHMAAMDLAVLMKESVHIVTDGTPAFSA